MEIPEGWKLVPTEPTEEMVQAGWDDANRMAGDFDPTPEIAPIYRAMLAAAPNYQAWISVTERLPQHQGIVLAWIVYNDGGGAEYKLTNYYEHWRMKRGDGEWYWAAEREESTAKVTHWCHLPPRRDGTG